MLWSDFVFELVYDLVRRVWGLGCGFRESLGFPIHGLDITNTMVVPQPHHSSDLIDVPSFKQGFLL